MTRVTIIERIHPFDVADLATVAGFERILAMLRDDPAQRWYVESHAHTCGLCGSLIRHTGLEATRDGDLCAHRCCDHDVRFPPPL